MKRLSLLVALCALPLAARGQPVFQPAGKSLADLHETRTDEAVITAGADLNKDGIKDLVIALDGYYSDENFAFYFGELTPAESILPVPKDLDAFLDPDKCVGQEELVARLKATYADCPVYKWNGKGFVE